MNMLPLDEQTRIEEIGSQLRDKVTSKFQTTAFLAGFALTLLGIELSIMWGGDKVPLFVPYAIGFLVLAGMFYVFALIRFDELTMPKRFWPEDTNQHDPDLSRRGLLTDQDLWAIKLRVVFYWRWLVIVALYMTGASLGLILIPITANFSVELVVRALISGVVAIVLAIVYVFVIQHVGGKNFPPMQRPTD